MQLNRESLSDSCPAADTLQCSDGELSTNDTVQTLAYHRTDLASVNVKKGTQTLYRPGQAQRVPGG